ncbi:MAG TPA: hypothetical protein VII06_29035 [Chloroflexota bacterium]|jgi:hypothetical protein
MAQDFPSENERKAFVEKLAQFRNGLPASEQRMLDAMAAAAFQPRDQGDVQGYGYFGVVAPPPAPGLPAPVGYIPTFYQTGYSYQWVNTPFGMAWQAVPTGFYQ